MVKSVRFRIAKNFSSLIIAQGIYKIFSLLMIILVARFLGAIDFGQFSYGLSFVWIFLFLSDLGLSELFIRDVSSDRKLIDKYISNILMIKVLLGLICYCFIAVLAYLFSFGTVKFWIIVFLGASIILDSFMYFFRCLFRVKETMEYEAVLMVIEAILKFTVVLMAIKLRLNITGAIIISIAFLLSSAINFLVNLAAFCLNYGKLKFSFEIIFFCPIFDRTPVLPV